MKKSTLLIAVLMLVVLALGLKPGEKASPEAQPATATVPLVLDDNRAIVGVEVQIAGGALRPGRAWIDTGGTEVILAEPLARELGIDISKLSTDREKTESGKYPVSLIRLGGIALDVEGLDLLVYSGRFPLPGIPADLLLPARCLRRLHVVFDYPGRQLTIAQPGGVKPEGTAVPCRVNPQTGLFLVETTIDGAQVALGVDTGSAGTWVSEKLTGAWLARHPDGPRALGTAGSTNFFGYKLEMKGTLVSLPGLTIGPVPVTKEIAVAGFPQALFDWYSKKSAARVAGFLGAELISRFRLEVDFPGQMTWWQPGPDRPGRDLDIVPLTLQPGGDGSYTVAGIVSRNGSPLLTDILPGDKLLAVDALDVTNASMGTVVAALRGEPGSVRVLKLERAGKSFLVEAKVVRLP